MVDERWTDDELRAAVEAYARMFDADCAGVSYSKSEVRQELLAGALPSRTKGSFEYRMANISAVLNEAGAAWLPGYRPARNVGANVKARLIPFLRTTGLL